MQKLKKYFLSFIALASASLCATAEVFRTGNTVCLSVSKNENSAQKKCGINDSIAVFLPKDTSFIQGIEIQIKIPQIVADYRNTIMYSLYDKISPQPQEGRIDYSGQELYSGTYPGQLVWSILVPLVRGSSIKQSPYADKTLIPDSRSGFVFLRNQLAMKGVPQSVMDAQFEVSAKAILSDMGALRITVPADSGEYSVVVDEKPSRPDARGLILLKPGKHNVSIVSEKFRNETRVIMITQAEVTEISVDLTSVAPSVTVNAPEGTRVFVDGEEASLSKGLELAPGDHIIKFEVGGYEVTKNVNIQNGKSYNIMVNVDATIAEQP